jgi:DNA polymerase III alpha subunit
MTKAMRDEHAEGVIFLDPKAEDIALHEIFYLDPEDRRAWETMRAIENRDANEGGDIDEEDEDFSFWNEKQMQDAWKKNPEALAKTLEIASKRERIEYE